MKVLFATDGSAASERADTLIRALGHRESVEIEVLSERLRGAGFRAAARMLHGPPATTIVTEAAAGRHHLTVVGAGRHAFLGRILLGSTSFHVLHAALCSVLIAHELPRSTGLVRVLIGYDGSDEAARAASAFATFADPERCRVAVLTVARTPAYAYVPIPVAPGTAFETGVRAPLVAEAEHIADEVADALRRRAASVATR
ncbi:MAG: universal stress protein [Actinomycetota bacterium]